jgi:hypothetical protein
MHIGLRIDVFLQLSWLSINTTSNRWSPVRRHLSSQLQGLRALPAEVVNASTPAIGVDIGHQFRRRALGGTLQDCVERPESMIFSSIACEMNC